MPKRIHVSLTAEQTKELEHTRHKHLKAYMRERAAAVLKVASGKSVSEVAEEGLLTRHEPETVYNWIKSYLKEGLAGWQIKTGRGRKPIFSPADATSSADAVAGNGSSSTRAPQSLALV